jgi:hypothetical protein
MTVELIHAFSSVPESIRSLKEKDSGTDGRGTEIAPFLLPFPCTPERMGTDGNGRNGWAMQSTHSNNKG